MTANATVASGRALRRLAPASALMLAGGAAAALALAGVLLGPSGLSVARMAQAVQDALIGAETSDPAAHAILLQIRLPRVVLSAAAGAALAVAGAALQGLFRNPLADPGLIGATSGAAVGAVTVIVLGGALFAGAPDWLRPALLPLAAFLGAMGAMAIVFRLAVVGGALSVATLLLAGVAISAIAAAVIGFMSYISTDQQLRDLTFWTMGGFGGATWTSAPIAITVTVLGCLAMLRFARALDLMQLGERAAFHSGVDVERVKWRIGVLASLLVGCVTAFCGAVGFIGLVAPHLARLIAGPSARILLPLAACIGAMLTLGGDLTVRLIAPPAEPPVGLATSLIGGPFFLSLILMRARQGGL